MREIKFRAWDGEIMIYPKRNLHITFFDAPSLVNWNIYDNDTRILSSQYCESVLMQYTGLKDKSGKEIYEGDVCKAKYAGGDGSDYINVVTWDNDGACFLLAKSFMWAWESFEVIGNQFENPDLLK